MTGNPFGLQRIAMRLEPSFLTMKGLGTSPVDVGSEARPSNRH